MIDVSQQTEEYLKAITDKLNEHIKHIEDFTYRINPEILIQIHIYTKHLRHNNVDKISTKIMEITLKLTETTAPDTLKAQYYYNIPKEDVEDIESTKDENSDRDNETKTGTNQTKTRKTILNPNIDSA